MTTQTFDLVCFGTDHQGESREQAKKALSVILKVDLQEAEQLLSRSSGIPLLRALSEKDAKALQSALGKVGVRCNYKPAATSAPSLEILPLGDENDPPDKMFECPECGTKSYFRRADESPPEVCASCGLVFAKYERSLQEKAEREAIRRQLLNARRAIEAEAEAAGARQAESVRRKKLEEELGRDLHLPRMFGTRGRLVGSATVLFVLGVGSGALAARLWSLTERPSSAVVVSATGDSMIGTDASPADPGEWVGKPGAAGTIDPGTQLLMTMEARAKKSKLPSGGTSTTRVRSEPRPATALGEGKPRSRSAFGNTLAVPDRNIEAGAEAIEALGVLAKRYADGRAGDVAAALLAEVRVRAKALNEGSRRVKALAQAAFLHHDAGDIQQAEVLFEQGLQQTERLPAGVERGLARAALAAGASRMGRDDQRDTLLRQANQEVLAIGDPNQMLTAVCEMAEYYEMAGQRGGALGLLDHVVRSARDIQDPKLVNSLFARAALAQVRAGDPNGALVAIAQIEGADAQDGALFALVEEAGKSHNAVWLEDLSNRLVSPRYSAAAFALLGEAQAHRGDPMAEVEQTFARAESFAGTVAPPGEEARVRGRIAQAWTRTGRTDKADPLFLSATRASQNLPDPKQRADALESIANQQAAVLLIEQAQSTASLLADPAPKNAVQVRIDDAGRIASILQPKAK